MAWLALTSIGYFLNSISILMDKILLRRAMPHPAVYAFSGAGLAALSLFLYPFVPGIPNIPVLLIGLGAGMIFTVGLFIFYIVLKLTDASEASPLVGSLTPVAVLLFAFLILDEDLSARQLVAFAIIVFASALLSRDEDCKKPGFELRILLLASASAALLGLSHVLSTYAYRYNNIAIQTSWGFLDKNTYDFLNAVVWRSMGCTLASLAFLIPRSSRRHILNDFRNAKPRTEKEFLVGKITGGASFMLINYAFTLGSVAIINALAGLQYLFLFILLIVIGHRKPRLLQENLQGHSLVRKFASLAFIFMGIALLS